MHVQCTVFGKKLIQLDAAGHLPMTSTTHKKSASFTRVSVVTVKQNPRVKSVSAHSCCLFVASCRCFLVPCPGNCHCSSLVNLIFSGVPRHWVLCSHFLLHWSLFFPSFTVRVRSVGGDRPTALRTTQVRWWNGTEQSSWTSGKDRMQVIWMHQQKEGEGAEHTV